MIENERWRVADRTADILSIDRDVCRRAFHREPEERVHEVVRWALSERDLSGHDDPERMIEWWARDQRAGLYGEDRRRADLEHVGGDGGPNHIGPRLGSVGQLSYLNLSHLYPSVAGGHLKRSRPGKLLLSGSSLALWLPSASGLGGLPGRCLIIARPLRVLQLLCDLLGVGELGV